MGGSSSTPVPDGSAGAAVITQAPPSGCPVQHTSLASEKSQPSVSECPAHQDSRMRPQASECPMSAGSGCDSRTIDQGTDALDPTNMVTDYIQYFINKSFHIIMM